MTHQDGVDAHLYPVNLCLSDKPVLVVGAGNVALRKIAGLARAGARVTVVGQSIHPALHSMVEVVNGASSPASIVVEARRYRTGEVAAYMLAVTCTDDPMVNARVHRDGVAAGVWVNSADDPENCDFTLSSVVRQGALQITVSTNGRSPALSMWLRERFEAEFDESWAILVDLLADVRANVRSVNGTSEIAGWSEALDGGLHELVAQGQLAEARACLLRHLDIEGVPIR